MDNNLTSILPRYTPIRDNIFKYLKPTDISKLCVITKYLLLDFEKEKYMNPLLEIFDNFDKSFNEVQLSDCNFILMGDDVKSITNYKATQIQLYMHADNYTLPYNKYAEEDVYAVSKHVMTLESFIFNMLSEDVHLLNISEENEINTVRISIYLTVEKVDLVKFKEPPFRLCDMDSNLNSLIEECNSREHEDDSVESSIYCLIHLEGISKYMTINLEVTSHKMPYSSDNYLLICSITPGISIFEPLLKLNI